MSRTRIVDGSLAVELGGTPDDVMLAEPRPDVHVVQLGLVLTLLLDTASSEYCRAVSAVFDAVADAKDQAAIVALPTPPPPAVDATVHTLCVPDYGTGAA